MRQFTFSAERVLDAPAEVVYHCLRDYQNHHNTAGFLPPIFTALDVLRGGVGAGTIIRFTTTAAGRSVTRTQEVSEPDPGHILVEWGAGEGSTFTVEPRGNQAFVRIETVLQSHGLESLLMRIFGSRVVRPMFDDELDRLERHARAHPALVAAA